MAKVKIKELRLRNFRAFENARFVLDDKLTVVIGRNGSGKSTLMEAFDFIRDALSDSLVNALDRRGRLINIEHKPKKGYEHNFQVAIEMVIENLNVLYGITLGHRNDNAFFGFEVREEVLITSDDSHSFHRTKAEFSTDVKAVTPIIDAESLLLPIIASQDKIWKEVLETLKAMRTYSISPSAIRNETSIGSTSWLRRDGANAGDILKQLEPNGKYDWKQERDWDWLTRYLSIILPGTVRIYADASPTGQRMIKLWRRDKDDDSFFNSMEMSDGTLRALGILLALRQQPTPTLVFIDEVEDSLDLPALEAILEAITESTDWCQVVISTHSTELLGYPAINGERVRLIRWEEGASGIYNLSDRMIKAIHPPYSVGMYLRENALDTAEEPETVSGDFFEVTR